MKINLVSINSKFIHSSLAALTISNMYRVYAARFGYEMPELTVTETTVNDSFDSIMYSVLNGADVFAFSVYIWNVSLVERVCRHIRLCRPDSTVIIGGPEALHAVSLNGELYDYCLTGDGERSFFGLACELCGFDVPEALNYSAEDKIRSAEYKSDLSEIEFPYSDKNIDNYNGRIIYYEASRGCPFSCAYCLSAGDGRVRELPIERVLADIDFFISHKVPQVKFVDRTFNCNRKRARGVWKHIIEAEGCETNFHFEIGADLLAEDDLTLLSSAPAGRIQFEAGIQSTNAVTLGECSRHMDMDRLFANVRQLVQMKNINIHVDLIAGLPYEGLESFRKSFNDTCALKAHQLQLGFLKLLYGSPMNGLAQKHGCVFSPYPPYEIISTDVLSYEDLTELKRVEDVLERFYNSNRFSRSLEKTEALFETPYDMFLFFADEFKKRGLTFRAVSTKVLYDFLSELFTDKIADFDKTLLLDFYTSEKSELVPSRLRYLAGRNGAAVKSEAMHGNKKAQVKIIGNDAYVIDYSKRNPVDGSFEIKEVIENVYL